VASVVQGYVGTLVNLAQQAPQLLIVCYVIAVSAVLLMNPT